MINEKKLLLGDRYKVNEHISLYNRTIGEVLDYGEEKYYRLIGSLISNPLDYKVALYSMNIDYEALSYFTFFCLVCKSIVDEDISIILGDLDLSKFQMAENNETNELVLWDYENDIVLDKKTYTAIVDYIRKIHGVVKPVRKPLNEVEKHYLIDKERYELELKVHEPHKPILFPLLSDVNNYRDLRMSTVTLFAYYINHYSMNECDQHDAL